MSVLGPTPTERELGMWPTKLKQQRAQLERALTAPRLPEDLTKRVRAALKAHDRAVVLQQLTQLELTSAVQALKNTPADTLAELIELLKCGNVKSFPIDLLEANRAARESVEYWQQADDMAREAVRILDSQAWDSVHDSRLLMFVAVERVRVGAGGVVSNDVRYLAQRVARNVQLPLEACKNLNRDAPAPARHVLELTSVRAEFPTMSRAALDSLGAEWLERWQTAHLAELRSFWSWCALLDSQIDRHSDPIRITADWNTRALLCSAMEAQYAQSPTAPRQPTEHETALANRGNGSVHAVIGRSHWTPLN